jgi:transposase
MEASGGYERDWARALRQAGIEVRIVDPKRVRGFALSAGRLAKNDKIEAVSLDSTIVKVHPDGTGA